MKENINNKKKIEEKRKERNIEIQRTKLICCLKCGSLGPKSYHTPPTKLSFFFVCVVFLALYEVSGRKMKIYGLLEEKIK